MPDFLKQFDGSGRAPRPVQVDAFNWINDNWRHPLLALQMPVGAGKSAIAKAISHVTGAHVITPSNTLIDQYVGDYPTQNYLKGKEHYECHGSGMSCYDWQNLAEMKACEGCPYKKCKTQAIRGAPTFFNPMSLFYASKDPDFHRPQVLVVDEAHQLAGMVSLLSGVRLRYSEYKFPRNADNERVLVTWLYDQQVKLRKLASYYKGDPKRLAEITEMIERLHLTWLGFTENAQNYVVYTESGRWRGRPETFLHIRPISPPRGLVRQVLAAPKIILLSGTLLPHDLQALLPDQAVETWDAPSPIPVANRRIQYAPAGFRINAETDPTKLGELIYDEFVSAGRPNTIAHVSYGAAERLRPVLGDRALFNGPADKAEAIARFKSEGGLFVAAGCAEGLDLKGDLCRLNLIPQLLFPNLGDPVVQKRRGLADGQDWYALETLKITIQQAGRSTRGPDDYSLTKILDPNFPWVYKSVKDKLPQSFKEAIKWSK